MNLLLLVFLSKTKGDYEWDNMHDVGTGDNLQNAGITVERRSLLLYLKPWTLGLVNSRARDDRTDPLISIVSDHTTKIDSPIIPFESVCKDQENNMHL